MCRLSPIALALVLVMPLEAGARAGPDSTPPAEVLRMPSHLVEVQVRPRIVLLEMQAHFPEEAWPELQRRVQSELSAMRLEVVRVVSRARGLDARMAELGARTTEKEAIGAMRITRHGRQNRVHVWLYDGITRKVLYRAIELPGPEGATRLATERVEMAALRAVELLHASLLELRLPSRASREAIRRVPPQVQRIIEAYLLPTSWPQSLERFHLWAGPSVLVNIGGGNPIGTLVLGGGLRLWPWLVLGAELALPLLTGTIKNVRGHADVALSRALFLVNVEPWPRARLSPCAGVGVGLALGRVAGTPAASDLRAEVNWGASAVVAGRLALALRLTRHLRLSAAASVDLATPPFEVVFGDQVTARLGFPALEGSLVLEWSWHR